MNLAPAFSGAQSRRLNNDYGSEGSLFCQQSRRLPRKLCMHCPMQVFSFVIRSTVAVVPVLLRPLGYSRFGLEDLGEFWLKPILSSTSSFVTAEKSISIKLGFPWLHGEIPCLQKLHIKKLSDFTFLLYIHMQRPRFITIHRSYHVSEYQEAKLLFSESAKTTGEFRGEKSGSTAPRAF